VVATAATAVATKIGPTSPSQNLVNPYTFLAGPGVSTPRRRFTPIYQSNPFWALLNLIVYSRRLPAAIAIPEPSGHYEQLSKSMSFVCHVYQEEQVIGIKGSRGSLGLGYLENNYYAMECAIRLISILPHSTGLKGDMLDNSFLQFMGIFIPLITNLGYEQSILIPGGWQTHYSHPDGTQKLRAHLLLYHLRNSGSNRYSLSVINTGPGSN